VSTKDGVFTVKLGSPLPGRKVSDVANLKHVFPFESFYTEAFLVSTASLVSCRARERLLYVMSLMLALLVHSQLKMASGR